LTTIRSPLVELLVGDVTVLGVVEEVLEFLPKLLVDEDSGKDREGVPEKVFTPTELESNSLPNKKTTTKINKETSLCIFTQLIRGIKYIISPFLLVCKCLKFP
jgi:hypothetical protein